MDKVVALFFIGIAVGISVPIIEKAYSKALLFDEPLTAIQEVFAKSARVWHFAISILILITLPTAIFRSLRNRFTEKKFFPVPFMTGISFGFTFMGAFGIALTGLQS